MKRSVFCLLDRYPTRGESYGDAYQFALEHALLADELGFNSLWLTEHHFQQLGSPNPAVLLAAIATQTQKLRIGPAVSVLPYRNPIHVAEDYAALDLLSRGRVNMGVGCGSQQVEFAGLGIDFDGRWETFERNLAALRELWSAESNLNIAPSRMPPIYVSTTSPERAQAIGRQGDSIITLLGPGTSETSKLSQILEAHQQGLTDGKHALDSAEVVVTQFAVVSSDEEQARREAVPALGRVVSLLSGSDVVDVDGLEAMYTSMQSAATACFGAPSDACEIHATLEKLGVKHVAYITRFGDLDPSSAHATLRHLRPEAMRER